MSRSSRKKERYENHTQFSEDKSTEGTSARTRPFSIDEIMLRRKNKKQFGDVKEGPGEAEDALDKQSMEKDFDCLESDIYMHHSSITNNKKNASENFVRFTSRIKDDNTSIKEGKLLKDKNKESRVSEAKQKAALSKHISDEAKGRELDRRVHAKRKHDEYETEKKRQRDFTGKDRYTDRSKGKSEKESKKEYRNKDAEMTKERIVGRKHDSRKLRDSEFSERKGRRESAQVHHEASRLKRRRSRSREHDNDRGRRSISVSPRTHKHASYDVPEHADLSSHRGKDKSGRSDSDVNKKKVSGHASNSHYRRHGGSDNRLGGYSPRKRRTEAAVKTPSPTNRSPEKKSAGWDLPPSGAESKLAGSVLSLESSNQIILSSGQEFSTMVPVASIVEKPVFGSFPNALSSKMNVSIDSIQLTQATRPMRRLYIENLPASASEKAVTDWLNNCLLSSGVHHIQRTQPCISCIIHKEKGQALVEFLTPEDASAALSYDGSLFSGCVLKIRRPKDFVEVATGAPERSEAAVNSAGDSIKDSTVKSVSNTVKDSSHKIFIGGISQVISSEMLKEIASAFGTLKAYRFEFNADIKEPCAFLEYVDQSVTLKACAGLNGMRLGGQVLTAVQTIPDTSAMEHNGDSPFYGIPEHAKPLLEKPTQVLKLKNVLNLEDLSSLSEADLEEILDDVRLECARFGTVKSVNVVKKDNCPSATETVNENTAAAMDLQDLNSDDHIKRTEDLEVGIDGELGTIGRSEPSDNVKPLVEDNDIVERNDICDNKLGESVSSAKEPEEISTAAEGNSVSDDKVGMCESSSGVNEPNVTGTAEANGISDSLKTDVEVVVHELAFADGEQTLGNLTCGDDKVADTVHPGLPEIVNKPFLKEPKSEEASKGASELDHSVEKELDVLEEGIRKDQVSDRVDVSEPGCILVEYRRIEASCLAAHCLHGRLFDDRIVTVGYVAFDVYRAWFPK